MAYSVITVTTAVISAVISTMLISLGKYVVNSLDFSGGIKTIEDKLEAVESYLKRETDLEQHTVRRINHVISYAGIAIEKLKSFDEQIISRESSWWPHIWYVISWSYHSIRYYLTLCMLNREFKRISDLIPEINQTNTVPELSNSGESNGTVIQSEDQWSQDPRKKIDHDVEVVGLDRLTEEIVKDLQPNSFNDRKLGVVSIYGMGGVGKSTLAKTVFNKVDNNHFPIKVWINVSQQYNVLNLRKDMLKGVIKVDDENLGKMTDKQVSDKLNQTLEERRYLIVLDDIWETESWDDIFYLERERHDNISPLKPIFPDKNNASRIILTTRNYNVANHPDHVEIFGPHEVKPLSDEDSWKLLKKKAFSRSHVKSDLESLGPKLAEKCKGLPLALVVLGGYLSKNLKYKKWEEMTESINWDEAGNISNILALSYHNLPKNLKPIFLYITAFPEDHIIKSSDLIKLWIAEDFIPPPRGNRKMETIARSYLDQLYERGLVQVVNRSRAHERIKRIRIHDVLRDWGIKRAQEDGFFQVINSCDNAIPSGAPIPYRVALHGYWDENLGTSMTHLHTLLGFNVPEKEISSDVLNYSLRIVSFNRSSIGVCGWSHYYTDLLYQMDFLKYICLRNCGNIDLPSSIGRLHNLQTIDCRECGILPVPSSLWEISTLRHVYLDKLHGDWCGPYKGLGKNLQVLAIHSSAVVQDAEWNETIEAVEEMKQLVRLDFFSEHLSLSIDILNRIKMLGSLEVLKLSPIEELTRIHGGTFPLTLVSIELGCDELEEDPMPVFWELPKLVVLKLYYNFHLKSMHCSAAGGFPRLKYLKILDFEKLEEWKVDNNAMTSLCHVSLQGCVSLRSFPEELMDHNQLQLLELAETSYLSDADYEKLEKQQKFKVLVADGYQDSRLSDL